MNKNSKRLKKILARHGEATTVKNQSVVKRTFTQVPYVHKKKAKPFPCPKPDETLTVREQMELLGYVPKSSK